MILKLKRVNFDDDGCGEVEGSGGGVAAVYVGTNTAEDFTVRTPGSPRLRNAYECEAYALRVAKDAGYEEVEFLAPEAKEGT